VIRPGVQMRSLLKAILAATILLALGGCQQKTTAGYQRLGRTVEIDPATGDTIITQFWMLGSGRAATFKRIPRGSTDRRGEPLPPAVGD
jgi:hypothetical protein